MHGTLWFDGACSGNPGPMGGGAVLVVDGHRTTLAVPLGRGTNNEAEYGGLLTGLRAARDAGVDTLEIRGDSQLVLRQVEGRYAVKAANLRPFYLEAKELLAGFQAVSLVWVPRAENAAADEAARQGAAKN